MESTFTSTSDVMNDVVLAVHHGDGSVELAGVRDWAMSTHRIASGSTSEYVTQLPPYVSTVTYEDRGPIQVIANPAAGDGRAASVAHTLVVPLLRAAGFHPTVIETKNVDHVHRMGAAWSGDHNAVVAIGGDGILHDLVNGLLQNERRDIGAKVELIMIPCGTANALYADLFPPELVECRSDHYKLLGLLSFISHDRTSVQPLPLMKTMLSPSSSPVWTVVVTSFALHAAILHHAEKLRPSHPGTERFKVAAQHSASVWWSGQLSLGPGTLKYDQNLKQLIPCDFGSTRDHFSYLACAVTSRFEPTFMIAPLRSSALPDPPTFDVVMIRPRRENHSLASPTSDEHERQAFVPQLWTALTAAYSRGKHIDLKGSNGDSGIVEYFRTSSLTWQRVLDPSEETSGLVCCDGALYRASDGPVSVSAEVSAHLQIWGRSQPQPEQALEPHDN